MSTPPRIRPLAPDRRAVRPLAGPEAGRSRTLLWATFAVLTFVLVGYFVSLFLRGEHPYWTWLDGWVVCGLEMVGSGLCLSRAFVSPVGRGAALALGCSLLAWSIGDIFFTFESVGGATPSIPSLADAFYLSFYPLAYVAVVLFLRGELKRLSLHNWLDGVIAGFGAAAVCGAFAFDRILQQSGTSRLATLTNLAYPIGDLLLLSLVIGGCAILPVRRRTPWILVATGIGLNVVGDTSNLLQGSFGATRFGFILNAIAWPTATILMSLAVWLRRRPVNPLIPLHRSSFLLPSLAAAAALTILVIGTLRTVSHVAVALAAITLFMVGLRLFLSVGEIQELSHERHRQSVTDDLTGLHNRRYLFRVLDEFFAGSDDPLMPSRTMAFLFIDLNHFKEVNDSFGHPAGDELLKQVGARLIGALRHADLLVRLGGDEFAVVLIDGDAQYAQEVAKRVTDALAEPFQLEAVSASISASIGIAMAPIDSNYSAGIVWCADVAMYRAKLGHIPVALFERALDAEGDQMRLLEELQEGIELGYLVLHYQPQLNLRTGEIRSVEALLRWAHPRLGLLPPDNFLPIAEEAGLMGTITKWVLEESGRQCTTWADAGRPLTVAVNVSPTNLLAPGFVAGIREHLARHELAAEHLILEITESSVIKDFETFRGVIAELHELGVDVSIDDFGAGATSLTYLSDLEVTELKLDRSFLTGLGGRERERSLELVRSTIELGHAMGMRIVAEGIEDTATLTLLAELGCDIAQGYFISRPKPASAFNPQLGTHDRRALDRGADAPL
jgi:diguanylate cyclase (GGDEF)-like protein